MSDMELNDMELLEGATAIARSAIAAGMSFFAGYPMSPFTEVLEALSREMPENDGVCINAASEIEGVNMALGAGGAGARAGTGSCGQGISLMQEAIAEAALNETPFVVFNMARGGQDYFQCTKGGGWGDYRTITLAPKNVYEAVEHTQLLFHLADKYRSPAVLYGDPLLTRTFVGINIEKLDFGELPAKDWALDGSMSGTGKSRQIWTWAMGKVTDPGPEMDAHWQYIAEKFNQIEQVEQRHEELWCDDADTIVVSWGTCALFAEKAVASLRKAGHKVGLFRPITLWPFPGPALERVAEGKKVLVYEANAGQCLEDVYQWVPRRQVTFIGRVSVDESGMNFGDLVDAPVVRQLILDQLESTEPATVGAI